MGDNSDDDVTTLFYMLVMGAIILVIGIFIGWGCGGDTARTIIQKQAIAAGRASYRADADGETEFYFIPKLADDAEAR